MNKQLKELFETINQQLKELSGLYRNAVSSYGISENEFWIWYTLIIMDGEYSQQDISGMWSLSKQTVNTIISNMVRKGFVALEVIPGTRNRKVIHLTEAGRKYGESIVLPIADAEEKAIEKLPVKEQLACAVALSKYISFFKEELQNHEIKNEE